MIKSVSNKIFLSLSLLIVANLNCAIHTFTNGAAITIPGSGTGPAAASPYPSTINVSGFEKNDAITKVTVSLTNISHTFPDDIRVLLVSPSGQKVIIIANAGGSADVTGVNLTFDDNASEYLPNGSTLVSGTFKPTSFGDGLTASLVSPAPEAPYLNVLSAFNLINPNGVWNLYVFDDAGADVGSIAEGWSITITTESSSDIARAILNKYCSI